MLTWKHSSIFHFIYSFLFFTLLRSNYIPVCSLVGFLVLTNRFYTVYKSLLRVATYSYVNTLKKTNVEACGQTYNIHEVYVLLGNKYLITANNIPLTLMRPHLMHRGATSWGPKAAKTYKNLQMIRFTKFFLVSTITVVTAIL